MRQSRPDTARMDREGRLGICWDGVASGCKHVSEDVEKCEGVVGGVNIEG